MPRGAGWRRPSAWPPRRRWPATAGRSAARCSGRSTSCSTARWRRCAACTRSSRCVAVVLALGMRARCPWRAAICRWRVIRVPRSVAIAPLAAARPARARGAVPYRAGAAAGFVQPGPVVLAPGGRLPRRPPPGRRPRCVVPADAHGIYMWGDPIDEPLEPLASTPWVRRGLVPYGGGGSQSYLDDRGGAGDRVRGRRSPGCPRTWPGPGSGTWWSGTTWIPASIGYIAAADSSTMTLRESGFARVAAFGAAVPASPLRPANGPAGAGDPRRVPGR